MKSLSVITIVLSLSMSVASATTLDDVQGFYTAPSTSCSYLEGDKLVPCGSEAKDCLVIKKLSNATAEIQVSSTQTNLHVCDVRGTATFQGNKLIYLDPEASEEDFGQGLKIEINKDKLVLGYLKQIRMRPPFCGMRAYLSRLEFKRKHKKPLGPECSSL
jgi:hypothetical protein